MPDGNTEAEQSRGNGLVRYGIEDRPENGEAVALGIQHLLAMFLSTVALPLVIASAIGLGSADITFIVQMALLVAGIATLVQVFPIGPVGARLPIVMGTSAIFVSPLIDIGSTYGLATIFGAVIIAAPVEVVIGYFFDDVEDFFPPLVTGIVVMLVGLTLIPIAIQYSAGIPGTDAFGSLENLGLAALVLVVALVTNQFFGGFMRSASVLIAVVVGYLAAIPLGLLDLSAVGSAAWFSFPTPLKYGIAFEPSAIILAAFAYIITSMETIGDVAGTTGRSAATPPARRPRAASSRTASCPRSRACSTRSRTPPSARTSGSSASQASPAGSSSASPVCSSSSSASCRRSLRSSPRCPTRCSAAPPSCSSG